MKKPTKIQNLLQSLWVMVLLIVISCLLCSVMLTLVVDIGIPIACLFSYDLELYMERLEDDMAYDGVKEAMESLIYRICAVPALFLAAPLSFRFSRGRARYFKDVTKARINYSEGMRMYIREHALYDAIMAAVLLLALWLAGRWVSLFPSAMIFYGYIHPIFGYLACLALAVLTIPVGAFSAQKKWRAQYICALDE